MIAAGDGRARLARLQGGAGEARHSPELAALLDRIERLRRRSRQSVALPAARLDDLLGGEAIAAGLIRIDRRHPFGQACGRYSLGHCLARAGAMLPTPLGELLFVDTETSGLAGGSGTIAWLIGLARVEATTLFTRQYLITSFAGEAAMLAAVSAEIAAATTLVTFNGKSFDLPLLATRLKLKRLPELAVGEHLDLLHPLRHRFKHELPDCRQRTLEEHVLGRRRDNDIPGAEAPGIWRALLNATADTAAVGAMVRHNRLDLLGMAGLLHVAAARAKPLPPSRKKNSTSAQSLGILQS